MAAFDSLYHPAVVRTHCPKEMKENERERTEKSEASKRSFPEVSFAAGYCFLSESNSPSELLKSGIPLAQLIPAPVVSKSISHRCRTHRKSVDEPQMTATRFALRTA